MAPAHPPCSVRASKDDHQLLRQIAAVLRKHPEAHTAIQGVIQPYLGAAAAPGAGLTQRVAALETAVAELRSLVLVQSK